MMFALRRPGAQCLASSSSIVRSTCVRTFASGGVSMELIKELRSQSGAPISECKKALEATSSNSMDEAMDWLRQHGAAKASSKLQGREASEGLVGVRIAENGSAASMVKISSETDFASRSPAFVNLVTHAADAALQSNVNGTVDNNVLMSTEFDSKTVKDALDEAVVAIRENLGVSNAVRLASDEKGRWVGYVHGRVDGSTVAGTAAALVHVVPKDDKDVAPETLQTVGKKLAMHVVAAKPLYLSPEDVPKDVLDKEREILTQQMADSGKPPEILAKIVNGRLRKFYEGTCLTEQSHMVEEGNPKVSKFLDSVGITVDQFETQSIS